jgi:PAS domain S-box-containing protein
MKLSFLRQKNPYFIAILAFAILIGFIAFLVGYNYLSQVELQKSILKNYHQKLDGDALALSYFFSERKDDLKNLPARREIAIFFENQALGMSMEYGLASSLNAVKRSFELFQEERKLDGKRVYTRIVFLDKFGNRLVDSQVNPAVPGEESWDRFLAPDRQSPFILVHNPADLTQVMVSSSFFFKGNYSGQILAWISPATINGYLSGTVGEIPHNVAQIFSMQGNFYLPFQPNSPRLLDISRTKHGNMHRFSMISERGERLEMVAEWAPIAGTPLGLVEAMPSKELLGGNTPWHLLSVLGSLSILFLLGIGLIWRTNNRTLALHIRLEEGALRQREIQEKNQQLQETALQLEQSKNMLQLIMESIPVRVFWKDSDLRYLGCNSQFARDAGLSDPKELLGKDDFAMGWREQAELYQADDRQVMESRRPKMNITEPQTTPTGGKIWLNTSKVPLQMANGEVIGVLGVYEDITARKQAEEEIRQQRDQLRSLAMRLAEVEETERQNLARELHDQVCQNLASLSLTLETLKIRAQREPVDQILSRLSNASNLVEQTGEITRDIMEGLRPTVLDHYGLQGGLRQLGSQFSQRTGIDLDILGDEAEPRLDSNVELALFRIAQEALNNVAKHARASHVVMTQELDQDTTRLIIADNGTGFDQNLVAAAKQGRGWGLMTMTERAMAVGGHCRIDSQPGQGTRVVVEVPC